MNMDQIKLDCATLEVGESVRMECPACGGDKTMTVTRYDNRLVYNCYRASCSTRGVLMSRSASGGFSQIESVRRKEEDATRKRAREFDEVFSSRLVLPKEFRDKLYETFGFVPPTAGVIPSAWHGFRILFEVRDYTQRLVGFVARRYDWTGTMGGPKSVSFGYSSHHWARRTSHGQNSVPDKHGLVIVEDVISAEKISAAVGIPSVALLGTSLSDECLSDIVRTKPSTVSVFLDPGAEGAAIKVAKRLRLFVGEVRIILADKDPKDLTKEELELALGVAQQGEPCLVNESC